MKSRTILLLIALGLLFGMAAVAGREIRRDQRPNLVLIVVDTMRADALSHASGSADTPHFDALARDGILFRQAFTHAPLTLPGHAAMFSGRLPHENGVQSNGRIVGSAVPLLAEHLRDEGYATAAAVSLATLWPNEDLRGLDRGFDHYDRGEHMVARAHDVEPRVRAALAAVRDAGEPFFLFAHFSDPHEPYCAYEGEQRHADFQFDDQAIGRVSTSHGGRWATRVSVPPGTHHLRIHSDHAFKLREFRLEDARGDLQYDLVGGELLTPDTAITVRVENPRVVPVTATLRAWLNDCPDLSQIRDRYKAEVEAADRAVGELIAELKEQGLYDESLIVLTSDHGEGLGEHGIVGHAVQLYDEVLHVPLVVKLPNNARPAHLVRAAGALVRHKDLAPTLLTALDVPPLPDATGRPIHNTTPRILLAEAHPPEAPQPLYAMRDATYKLIYFADDDRFELYALATDPLELENVFPLQGHFRTQWQVDLKHLAKLQREREAEEAEQGADVVDAEVAERVRALGY